MYNLPQRALYIQLFFLIILYYNNLDYYSGLNHDQHKKDDLNYCELSSMKHFCSKCEKEYMSIEVADINSFTDSFDILLAKKAFDEFILNVNKII